MRAGIIIRQTQDTAESWDITQEVWVFGCYHMVLVNQWSGIFKIGN